jgi:aminoglycoside phosphotransferase (APT) family kinase protein
MWEGNNVGCRGLPRCSRSPSPSRSGRESPPRATPTPGPSVAGSRARTRPRAASPTPDSLARDLAGFVAALRRIDPPDGPPAGRGVPLATRDAPTRAAIAELRGIIDTIAVTAAWEEALRIPEWSGPPAWVHGDLSPGNVLLVDGRLSAVIDFGGVGDPTVDLIVAWNLLPAGARKTFHAALRVDDATWARGRGWAQSIALIQLPYYRDTNPVLATNARYMIHEVLAEHGQAP